MAMSDKQKKDLVSVGIGLVACFVAYRYGPNAIIKTAAASVGSVIVAGQLPIIGTAMFADNVFSAAAA